MKLQYVLFQFCLFVCLSVTLVHCVKTAEQVEWVFVMKSTLGQCYIVLYGCPVMSSKLKN